MPGSMLIWESRFSSNDSMCSCSACPGTHNIQLGSAVFFDLAMAEKVQPSPSKRSRPWPCTGPGAAEQESWQSLEAHLPADPSICVYVTSKTFSDVSYCSLYGSLDRGWTAPYLVHSALPTAPS